MPAAFAGLSRSLPALAYANEMQARAAGLGYDWPDLEGVIDKVAEEATELLAGRRAGAPGARSTATCCSCSSTSRASWTSTRRPRCEPPAASSRAGSRGVERLADDRSVQLKALGLDALDELWQDVKREEAAARDGQAAREGGHA